jgi:hypothetical protein
MHVQPTRTLRSRVYLLRLVGRYQEDYSLALSQISDLRQHARCHKLKDVTLPAIFCRIIRSISSNRITTFD